MSDRSTLVSGLKSTFDTPLSSDTKSKVLSHPPFVQVPGSFNTRYLTSDLSHLQDTPLSTNSIKPHYIYRSGALSHLRSEGQDAIRRLGIKTIFDLRSEKERTAEPDPTVEGVKAEWYPNTKDNITIIPDTKLEADGTLNFEDNYLELLISHRDVYRAILLHIRDHPDRPLLYHCLGGKDRTGVISALILYIAGIPLETISLDYILTRAGIEPARVILAQKAKEAGAYLNPENPRFQLWAQCPYEAIGKLFKRMEDQEYKGVDGYLHEVLGLSEADLGQIRNHLLVPAGPAAGRL